MKKGDFVDIYRSTYKSKDFEGKAELIKSIKQSSYLKKLGFQIWTVKMLNIETSKEFKTKRIIEVLVKEQLENKLLLFNYLKNRI